MSLEEWNATSPVRVSGKIPTQIVTGVMTTVPYGATTMSASSMSPSSPPSSLSHHSLVLLVPVLLDPAEPTRSTDECWMFRSSRSSTILERMSVRRLLRFEKVTNLRTNSSPQIALAKFVVLVDRLKLHETRILLWPPRAR